MNNFSYESRAYESVDKKSRSEVMSLKTMKKKIRAING